jgi:hypothetical protein
MKKVYENTIGLFTDVFCVFDYIEVFIIVLKPEHHRPMFAGHIGGWK